jgi:hypothetical protein
MDCVHWSRRNTKLQKSKHFVSHALPTVWKASGEVPNQLGPLHRDVHPAISNSRFQQSKVKSYPPALLPGDGDKRKAKPSLSAPYRYTPGGGGRGGRRKVFLLILNLGSRWRWAVFTLRPLYLTEKQSTNCTGRWEGRGHQSRSHSPARIRTPDLPTHSLVTISTPSYRLL